MAVLIFGDYNMKKILIKFCILSSFLILLLLHNCAGPHSVSVGVGVGVAGPWGNPYPGGSIMIGRPVGGGYYPLKEFEKDIRYVVSEPYFTVFQDQSNPMKHKMLKQSILEYTDTPLDINNNIHIPNIKYRLLE